MAFKKIMALSMLLIPSILFASNDAPVNFGFLGGVNFSYMEGNDIEAMEIKYKSSAEFTLRGNFGIRAAYALKKWLELESGAFFSGNGYEMLIASADGGVDWSNGMPRSVSANLYNIRNITFLEFPLALRLQTPYFSNNRVKIFAFGGIRAGIVVSAKDKLVVETVTSNFPDQGDSKDREDYSVTDLFQSRIITDSLGHQLHYTYNDFYRRGNISFVLGGGFERRYSVVGFFALGQYVFGLSNFNKLSTKARNELAAFQTDSSSGVVFLGQPEAFFRSFQLSGGLNFYIPGSN
jgi:hypothetical protein